MVERRRAPSAATKDETFANQSQRSDRRRHSAGRRYFIIFAVVALFFSSSLILRQDVSAESEALMGACGKYKGILMITQGDSKGAAGTIFFLFVLNQILYAEKHSLIPWVHLNDVSQYVYDPEVHGKEKPISFEVQSVVNANWTKFVDPISKQDVLYAGAPTYIQPPPTKKSRITVTGSGVWNSYFYPVSQFTPNDPSCARLPLVRLTHQQIIPALHVHCPWSLRAWRYGGLPPSLRSNHLSYNKWFSPMRERGADLVEKYIQFLPYLHRMAQEANPFSQCLAMHIRHSDKANKRRKIPVEKFLPYAQAFVEEKARMNDAGGGENYSIYLATDSWHVMENIKHNWPPEIVARIRWQSQVVRSNDTTPVFVLSSSHHLTNIQVLVDIIAMSKCQFLLHGLSAVSEATHYLNRNLHNQHSVNLELQRHPSVDKFREMIKKDTSSYV